MNLSTTCQRRHEKRSLQNRVPDFLSSWKLWNPGQISPRRSVNRLTVPTGIAHKWKKHQGVTWKQRKGIAIYACAGLVRVGGLPPPLRQHLSTAVGVWGIARSHPGGFYKAPLHGALPRLTFLRRICGCESLRIT